MSPLSAGPSEDEWGELKASLLVPRAPSAELLERLAAKLRVPGAATGHVACSGAHAPPLRVPPTQSPPLLTESPRRKKAAGEVEIQKVK